MPASLLPEQWTPSRQLIVQAAPTAGHRIILVTIRRVQNIPETARARARTSDGAHGPSAWLTRETAGGSESGCSRLPCLRGRRAPLTPEKRTKGPHACAGAVALTAGAFRGRKRRKGGAAYPGASQGQKHQVTVGPEGSACQHGAAVSEAAGQLPGRRGPSVAWWVPCDHRVLLVAAGGGRAGSE